MSEINIAVTGRNGSGKSSLIACIYEALREKLPGYFSLPEAEDFDCFENATCAGLIAFFRLAIYSPPN